MVLPFGRYCGRSVEEVPDNYLEWLLSLSDLREPLRSAVEFEWGRRANGNTPAQESVQGDQGGMLYVAPEDRAIFLQFVEDSYWQIPRRKEQGLNELSDDMRRLKNILRSLRKQLRRGTDEWKQVSTAS